MSKVVNPCPKCGDELNGTTVADPSWADPLAPGTWLDELWWCITCGWHGYYDDEDDE